MACDPFYNPPEEDRKKGSRIWNDIELVCRNADNVERFMELPVTTEPKTLKDRLKGQR
jgi:hypothetical protein